MYHNGYLLQSKCHLNYNLIGCSVYDIKRLQLDNWTKNLATHGIHNDDNNTKVGQSKENRKKGDIKLMLQ